jgi:hypothetical protein
MSRPVFSSIAVAVVCAAAAACSSPSDHLAKDGNAVGGENPPNDLTPTPPNPNHDEGNPDPGDDQGEQPGPTCDKMPAPIPEGWKVYARTGFSVAAPSTGFSADLAVPTMVQLFPETPGTLLGAAARTDGATMDFMVKSWTSLMLGKGGHNCTVTSEATTYLCDDAIQLHGACENMRSIEVMLVKHGGLVYFTACDLSATGDRDVCAKFMTTLRFD